MVASPEQLVTLGIIEYRQFQRREKWWLLRPSNLLWRRWGSVIWLLTSHYYCGATTGVNLSLQLCTQYCCMAGGAGWRMSNMSGETKLNCFWHCYQSFRICLYVRIILMKLYCDAMKVSTLVPAGKKRFQLRIHVSCLEIISLQHSIKYKWNYHG